MMKSQGKPAPDRRASLAARPRRNPAAAWRNDEAGLVEIAIEPRQTRAGRWLRVLATAPPRRTLVLDEIGSEIWRRCDGKNSVQDLMRFVMERYQFTRKEAEMSVTPYLRQLGQRGLIGMEMSRTQ